MIHKTDEGNGNLMMMMMMMGGGRRGGSLEVVGQAAEGPSEEEEMGKRRRMAAGGGGGDIDGHHCPSPPTPPNAIFVPLLRQIGPVQGEEEEERRSERGQQQQGGRGRTREMANGSRWNRRTIGLTLLLSLLLLSGTFALFDSLESNGNSGNDEEGREENGEVTEDDAKNYLNRFGYIGETGAQADRPENGEQPDGMVFSQQKHRTADQLMDDFSLDSLKSAIQRFQEFAGLPKTGELDNQTKRKMKQPRCGMQDVEMIRGRGGGGEAYVPKWRKARLSYTIDHYTGDLPQYMQKKAIQMAFSAWSQHVPLDFAETTGQTADIHVRFARSSHGDPWPFDGRGGVLAHATFPSNGQLHFDDDEQWAFMDASKIASSRYTDLFWVSLHEIGHVLGISHSKVETAIMAPFYLDPEDLVDWRGNYKTPKLTSDDIRAAQQIYGARSSRGNGAASRRTGGHYDDNEGGFLSQLGKFLEGGSDNDENDDGEEAENGGGEGRHGHWGGNEDRERRRHHTRKSQDGEDEGGGLLSGFFSGNAGNKMAPSLMMTLLAFLLLTFSFAI